MHRTLCKVFLGIKFSYIIVRRKTNRCYVYNMVHEFIIAIVLFLCVPLFTLFLLILFFLVLFIIQLLVFGFVSLCRRISFEYGIFISSLVVFTAAISQSCVQVHFTDDNLHPVYQTFVSYYRLIPISCITLKLITSIPYFPQQQHEAYAISMVSSLILHISFLTYHFINLLVTSLNSMTSTSSLLNLDFWYIVYLFVFLNSFIFDCNDVAMDTADNLFNQVDPSVYWGSFFVTIINRNEVMVCVPNTYSVATTTQESIEQIVGGSVEWRAFPTVGSIENVPRWILAALSKTRSPPG